MGTEEERRVDLPELVVEVSAIRTDVSDLGDAFYGTPRPAIEGGGRRHDGLTHTVDCLNTTVDSMVPKVDEVYKIVTNGDLESKVVLAFWQKAGALLAFALIVWREVSSMIGGA